MTQPSDQSSIPPAASGPSSQQSPGTPTSDDRTMAMLAHVLAIFTWIIGPLIIWLIKKDQSPFVNDQGKEAINFQITVTIGYIAVTVLTCLTLGLGYVLMPVIWALNLIFCILAAVAANNGDRYRYPINWRLIT